jgi:hypothetical protein
VNPFEKSRKSLVTLAWRRRGRHWAHFTPVASTV